MHCTVGEVKTKSFPLLSPEKLSRMWSIGLKNMIKTLYATTYQCIRSTGILAERFKTDKAQLRYKTWSSPRFSLRSHSLICIKNHLFIIEIGPILNKELEFIF